METTTLLAAVMPPSTTRRPAVNAAVSDAEPFGQRALMRHGTAGFNVPARTEAVVTVPVAPIHPAPDHGASGVTSSGVGLRCGTLGKCLVSGPERYGTPVCVEEGSYYRRSGDGFRGSCRLLGNWRFNRHRHTRGYRYHDVQRA